MRCRIYKQEPALEQRGREREIVLILGFRNLENLRRFTGALFIKFPRRPFNRAVYIPWSYCNPLKTQMDSSCFNSRDNTLVAAICVVNQTKFRGNTNGKSSFSLLDRGYINCAISQFGSPPLLCCSIGFLICL